MASNPVKLIKMNFATIILEDIEATNWWEMKRDELFQNEKFLLSILNGN